MDPLTGMLMGGLGVGGNLLGNLMGNTFNQQNIQQQEAFQASMSNTAYQRASADMKAAGINPIMAFSHPETAPSGGAAQMGAPALGDAAVSGIMSAVNAAKTAADTANAAKMGDQIDAQTDKIKTERLGQIANTALTWSRNDLLSPEKAKAVLDDVFYHSEQGKASRIGGDIAEEGGRGGLAGPVVGAGTQAVRGLKNIIDSYTAGNSAGTSQRLRDMMRARGADTDQTYSGGVGSPLNVP